MNRFKQIPAEYSPAYAWDWNTKIDRDGIKERIDRMYKQGIRAFYVIGEPKNFRYHMRRTFLEPDYLSEEYLELLRYAHRYAAEKGMYTWLYNEGGYPSGSACGNVLKRDPSVARKFIKTDSVLLPAGTPYAAAENAIAAFCGETRVRNGDTFGSDAQLTVYSCAAGREIWESFDRNLVDIADEKTCSLFLEETHEKIKRAFGSEMAKSPYMFDDEANTGDWTPKFSALFSREYGYDIADYLPCLVEEKPTLTDAERQARIDYHRLFGKLVRENYFLPMKKWLNENKMLSIGHLNCENTTDQFLLRRYGNMLMQLRAFDIPGIDVIWGQISYPVNGKCTTEGNTFFPRLASSAAHQNGGTIALSESFCVYSEALDCDAMRFIVGYQAVRGINLFNFMSISYGRESALPFQFRPNFLPERLGREDLYEINGYTARLSALLQTGTPRVRTALYYPFASIAAGSDVSGAICADFERLGDLLEHENISFDLVDEEFVRAARVENGALVKDGVVYDRVFVPDCPYEDEAVREKLARLNHDLVSERLCAADGVKSRTVDHGDESFCFLFNENDFPVEDTARIADGRNLYAVDLTTGEVFLPSCRRDGGAYWVEFSLTAGNGMMLWLTKETLPAAPKPKTRAVCTVRAAERRVICRHIIDDDAGERIITPESVYEPAAFAPWEHSFSGVVSYRIPVGEAEEGCTQLDLGKVVNQARVFVNGTLVAAMTMFPFVAEVPPLKRGDCLEIRVANTLANAFETTKFFDSIDPAVVGNYHAIMVPKERAVPCGGLYGPVILKKEC